jgi:hypothetical protein
MALVRGFDRSSAGALATNSAGPATDAKRIRGWAVDTISRAHRSNATAGVPAGAVLVRGRAYTSLGAVCYKTTVAATDIFILGIRHGINGAMLAKSAAPGATARSNPEGLLYDPADGACFFDSVA